jgi:hypothetical protein
MCHSCIHVSKLLKKYSVVVDKRLRAYCCCLLLLHCSNLVKVLALCRSFGLSLYYTDGLNKCDPTDANEQRPLAFALVSCKLIKSFLQDEVDELMSYHRTHKSISININMLSLLNNL